MNASSVCASIICFLLGFFMLADFSSLVIWWRSLLSFAASIAFFATSLWLLIRAGIL